MDIRPFRGLRFSTEGNNDVSTLIAPPYDVLSATDKDELLAGNPRNIVAVDLPQVPPDCAGPDEVYQAASEKLRQWMSEGFLSQESSAAIYVYDQTFTWAGRTHTRRAMICAVRATELGKDVIPHEHTFEGPKADRLKLTQFCRMQLSAILGFYADPNDEVAELLSEASAGAPAMRGQLGDVAESLWVVTQDEIITKIAALLSNVPAFIADGHHRYSTALNYRDTLASEGKLDENHPANFVMFSLVARNDPGLLVLPTHRAVRNLAKDFSIDKLVAAAGEFSWQRCSVEDADLTDADGFLGKYGRGAMALMGSNPAEIWIAQLRDESAMIVAAPDESDAWRALDAAVLHKLIIDKALTPWRREDIAVDYTPLGSAILAGCASGRTDLGICLQSTPVEAIEQIALSGGSMPHKSTYFYPKLATGMVLKPLE